MKKPSKMTEEEIGLLEECNAQIIKTLLSFSSINEGKTCDSMELAQVTIDAVRRFAMIECSGSYASIIGQLTDTLYEGAFEEWKEIIKTTKKKAGKNESNESAA